MTRKSPRTPQEGQKRARSKLFGRGLGTISPETLSSYRPGTSDAAGQNHCQIGEINQGQQTSETFPSREDNGQYMTFDIQLDQPVKQQRIGFSRRTDRSEHTEYRNFKTRYSNMAPIKDSVDTVKSKIKIENDEWSQLSADSKKSL